MDLRKLRQDSANPIRDESSNLDVQEIGVGYDLVPWRIYVLDFIS